MGKWTKTAGLLFLAASAVYSDRALGADAKVAATPASPASPAAGAGAGSQATAAGTAAAAGTDVKLLQDGSDPVFGGPTTQPAAAAAGEGKSLNASDVNVSGAGTVELHVNDANLIEVLRMLSMQSQKNIIASKDVHGTVTANLYDVTVREALDAILHANGYAYREQGNFIYVYTAKELQEMEKASRKATTEVFHLYYTPAANVATLIKPVLSGEAQVSVTTPAVAGISSGAGDVGGNTHSQDDMVVVTDYPDNLERVRKIIKEVDRRPQQILIEATILRAGLSEDNALGVDFNVLGGVDFATIAHSAGQIIGGEIRDGTATGSKDIWGASGGTGNNFSSPIGGGLKLGVVTNNVSVFVSALEGITDTTVLANPKILALNKQRGEVIVGRKDGYLTTTVTENATVQTVEFLDTGTRLVFRPFIADDGFIRMEVHPEDSSGGLTDANLPFKVTTEVTSNIMVKDGKTIVIGGLFREDQNTARAQVPFLGNIPLAGYLFRRQRDRTQRDEVIILLTPHIIKDERVYSDASEKLLADGEKMRVGVRNGMMPWGRERMAESAYEKAVAEMNKPTPDRKKALWHLDEATNLNPRFLEAITLKQELTGREVSTVDNSTIRSFVRQQILAERALPATMPSDLPPRTDASNGPATRPVAQADDEASTEVADDGEMTGEVADDGEWAEGFESAQVTENADTSTVTELPALAAPTTAPSVTVVELTDEDDLDESEEVAPANDPAHSEQSMSKPVVTEVPIDDIVDDEDSTQAPDFNK